MRRQDRDERELDRRIGELAERIGADALCQSADHEEKAVEPIRMGSLNRIPARRARPMKRACATRPGQDMKPPNQIAIPSSDIHARSLRGCYREIL